MDLRHGCHHLDTPEHAQQRISFTRSQFLLDDSASIHQESATAEERLSKEKIVQVMHDFEHPRQRQTGEQSVDDEEPETYQIAKNKSKKSTRRINAIRDESGYKDHSNGRRPDGRNTLNVIEHCVNHDG